MPTQKNPPKFTKDIYIFASYIQDKLRKHNPLLSKVKPVFLVTRRISEYLQVSLRYVGNSIQHCSINFLCINLIKLNESQVGYILGEICVSIAYFRQRKIAFTIKKLQQKNNKKKHIVVRSLDAKNSEMIIFLRNCEFKLLLAYNPRSSISIQSSVDDEINIFSRVTSFHYLLILCALSVIAEVYDDDIELVKNVDELRVLLRQQEKKKTNRK